jgi:hypothetical protein
MNLSDDQMINAVNNPWITQENPLFRSLGEQLLEEAVEQLEIISLARKIFHPRLIKAGEVIRYDKDIKSSAYSISLENHPRKYNEEVEQPLTERTPKEKIEAVKRGENARYVYPDEFEVCAYLTLPTGMYREIEAVKGKIKELKEKGLYSIQSQEDTALINLLTMVGENHLNIKSDPYYILDNLIDTLDKQRFICDNILLNRKDANFITENVEKFKDLELFNTQKNYFAKQSLRDAGYIGRYKASMLITTAKDVEENIIPEGNTIAVTNGAYVGGMPIRVPLFSETCSEEINGEKCYGYFWYELLSMLVINPNAVVLGQIKY